MTTVDSLLELDTAAIYTDSAQEYITHSQLRRCVQSFRLPPHDISKKPVVAVAIPNGPLLALTIIAVSAYCVAAPVNPSVGPDQLRADVIQSRASVVLTTKDEYQRRGLGKQWTRDAGLSIYTVDLDADRHLALETTSGAHIREAPPMPLNVPDDVCIQLFTSGTSGTKKLVPITTQAVIKGAQCVIESWGLSKEQTCLNMMPLHHVGGLVRNVFAPIFAGGSTVCCPAFDPSQFWDLVERELPTWYYASPTMHSLILDEAKRRPDAVQKSRINLICNAAGGLLPSLAGQLLDTFHCCVLPSYGMTECMPISTPPLDYKLERSGTSGVSVGPEICIMNQYNGKVNAHIVGRIHVRGVPLFHGYLQADGTLDKSVFNAEGWFDTGDMGYMDEDGYLYVTGRSKEVINRGGELISPFEVEDTIVTAAQDPESLTYLRITQALAFSVPHEVLQEVVGVVLVTPVGQPRVDIKALQQSLRSRLQQAKWPSVIVYMDDLPKRNNKIARSRLSERLGLPELSDPVEFINRHWEAQCPPLDADLSQPIESARCNVDVDLQRLTEVVSKMLPELEKFISVSSAKPEIWLSPKASGQISDDKGQFACEELSRQLASRLHNYLVPERIRYLAQPFKRNPDGSIDQQAIQASVNATEGPVSNTADRVKTAMASVLSITPTEVPLDTDFFTLGGDSIRAGRLLSMLRAEFNCRVPIELIFNQGSAKSIAAYLEQQTKPKPESNDGDTTDSHPFKQHSSSNRYLMALQLFPLVVFYPMRRAFEWTVFLITLSTAQDWPTNQSVLGRLFNITLAIFIAKLVSSMVFPWVGIIAKWIIIWRYKPGLYPMWGIYHTRHWMVEKIVAICGMGFFGKTNFTRVLYYRLMGASIGRGVSIGGSRLGEWDLIDIRDGATLDSCLCRSFAGAKNTMMYLGRITVGRNAVVCRSSILAPGTTVPENACIGANSSSWELDDSDESFRDLPSNKIPTPHWALTVFGTVPLYILSFILSLVPWWLGLIGLAISQPAVEENAILSILNWFASSNRIGFHYLALILRATLSPFVTFGFVVCVRWALDDLLGPLKPGPASSRSQIDRWRMALMKTLMPTSQLHKMTELLGQHYEGTSIAVRLLGGKVGKRVYWPGTGPTIGDYHLVQLGDDVVFGSRSHIVTSDGLSSEYVSIGDNAMIADRVSLLPGVSIGRGAVLGSGALTRRGKHYESNTTWVGSRGGDGIRLRSSEPKKMSVKSLQSSSSYSSLHPSFTSEDISDMDEKKKPQVMVVGVENLSASPFGRAFYQKKAPYYVLRQWAIIAYSFFLTAFAAFYWNIAFIFTIQAVYLVGFDKLLGGILLNDAVLSFAFVAISVSIINTLLAILALLLMILAKWALLGQRQPGNYDWDKSSYCQRWQLFLSIEKLRRNCFRGNGILGMLTGTRWIVMYFQALGAKIGRDCALFANGQPSLYFTEPDLLTIGDRVVVDDASLVGHVNTRGKFDLNELHVGDRCVLRSGSRLLSGARMGNESCLLEHTLVMAGDVVEEKAIMQGWPAQDFSGKHIRLA